MKRQLIAGLAALLIVPGVFFYQPSSGAEAAQTDGTHSAHWMAQADESKDEHKDVPWVPILILALIVPTAVLVVPSFLMAKKEEESGGPGG